jgi:putative membrane protein insertion efficiency factor
MNRPNPIIYSVLRQPLVALLRAAVRAYQLVLSPLIGPRCRHLPSCSDYAREALERHGSARGSWLALRRLVRCHPWGTSGYDPVP